MHSANIKRKRIKSKGNKLDSNPWTSDKLKMPCNDTISELEGVTCNNETVFRLNFASFGIGGSISPFISNCTNLQSLDPSANSFFGEISTELQYLVNLAVLNLSVNEIQGSIPIVNTMRIPKRHRSSITS